jgi:hypothetical protein
MTCSRRSCIFSSLRGKFKRKPAGLAFAMKIDHIFYFSWGPAMTASLGGLAKQQGQLSMEEEEEEEGLYSLFVSEEYTEMTWRFETFEQKLLASTASCTDHDLTGQIVWPASVLLAWFVYKHAEQCFANEIVVELGAGAGLGGFVAANWSRHAIITDGNGNILSSLPTPPCSIDPTDPTHHPSSIIPSSSYTS